jgi:hypothetical protein
MEITELMNCQSFLNAPKRDDPNERQACFDHAANVNFASAPL